MQYDPNLVAAVLRSDLYSFVQAAFPRVAPGSPFLPNWHPEAIAYALTRVLNGETRRLIITIPPRSLKSISASVAFQTGDLLHPTHEPQHILDDLKAAMGTLDFSAQYQQQPVRETGNLIKWAWSGTYDEEPSPEPGDRIIVSWDTALTAKELSSYSACVVLQVRKETVFVFDVIRQRLEFPDLRRMLIRTHKKWSRATSNYALLIENKGSGMSLIQDLRRDGIHAIAVDPEGDKIMRMQAQTARIEADSVLPDGALA